MMLQLEATQLRLSLASTFCAIRAVSAHFARVSNAASPKGDPAGHAGSSIEIIRADRGAVGDAEGGTVNASSRLVDLRVGCACG